HATHPNGKSISEIGFVRLWCLCHDLPPELFDTAEIEVGGAAISSVQSRHLPYCPACSTRGNARGHPHSMPRGVQEYSDPSLGGFHSSRRADRAKDRRPTDGPRTSSRYRCCRSRGPA